ncbi:hypothetical protein GCM10027290_35630 [Micromonospora sonneratiae]|uniref:TlpA family protein disulfide reductase n=1 Tax=Micromonospora sonneratiae TaxID=1184706 RepID=A0ABW3YB03_9ACTN
MNRLAAGLLLPLLLLTAACTSTEEPPKPSEPVAAPFADCAGLTGPPKNSSTGRPTSGTAAPADAVRALPDVQLPCFTGGAEVPVDELRGPAVINVWASWCPPCRKELPAFQRLADRAGDRVHVVGVNTRDDRDAAVSAANDLGLTFPNLFDRSEKLRSKLQRSGLPITVFVDGQGRIRHVDTSGALDDTTLASLVDRHLGVATAL